MIHPLVVTVRCCRDAEEYLLAIRRQNLSHHRDLIQDDRENCHQVHCLSRQVIRHPDVHRVHLHQDLSHQDLTRGDQENFRRGHSLHHRAIHHLDVHLVHLRQGLSHQDLTQDDRESFRRGLRVSPQVRCS